MEIGKYRVQWHGPMSLLHANNGVEPRFLKEQEAHKWLSCIVNTLQVRGGRVWIAITVFRPRHGPVRLTRRYCVTETCPFYVGAGSSKNIILRLLVHMQNTVPFTKLMFLNYRRFMRMVGGPPAGTN